MDSEWWEPGFLLLSAELHIYKGKNMNNKRSYGLELVKHQYGTHIYLI